MKISAIIRHPLSNKNDTFSIKGDCICCGEPAHDTWTYHRDYKLERWVGRARGKAGIVTVTKLLKDSKGRYEKGHVQFSAPLCAKHLHQTHSLRYFETIELSMLVGFILLSTSLYIAAITLDWSLLRDWRIPPYAKYLILPFVVLLSSTLSGILAMTIINRILSKYSFFHNYPLETNAGGVSGLGFEINQANQKERGLRAKYELVLNFTREDVADEFLNNYPQALPIPSKLDYIVRNRRLHKENKRYTGDV